MQPLERREKLAHPQAPDRAMLGSRTSDPRAQAYGAVLSGTHRRKHTQSRHSDAPWRHGRLATTVQEREENEWMRSIELRARTEKNVIDHFF